MIKDLFYFLYWFYTKSKAVKSPSIHSFVDISIIMGFNLMTLYIISFHFLGIGLAHKNIDGGLYGVFIGIVIMLINYFSWFSKRHAIIEKYKLMHRKEKVRRSIIAIFYVILSLLSFYFSAKAFLPWW